MLALSHCAVQFDWHKNGNFQILAKLSTEHQCQFKMKDNKGLTCQGWVCRNGCRPSAWSAGALAALVQPPGSHSLTENAHICPRAWPDPKFSHFWLPRVQVLRPPSRSTVGQPVFIEVVVLVAINLSLPSGLPRATKRARLGLPTLPPPIRKPRLLRVAAARGVTSQKYKSKYRKIYKHFFFPKSQMGPYWLFLCAKNHVEILNRFEDIRKIK